MELLTVVSTDDTLNKNTPRRDLAGKNPFEINVFVCASLRRTTSALRRYSRDSWSIRDKCSSSSESVELAQPKHVYSKVHSQQNKLLEYANISGRPQEDFLHTRHKALRDRHGRRFSVNFEMTFNRYCGSVE